jgi:CRISPR-associated protein Csx3
MTNRAPSRFPAILIGGPQHAGKSVLSYSLKQRLKESGIQFYQLAAAPDGEGDWSQESQPDWAKALRRKGRFTAGWANYLAYDIAHRPLPFLVDAGGQPGPWDEAIFDQCTHAIILAKDEESQALWHAIAAKYNLLLIADLTSQLSGQSIIESERPVLKGVLTRLERHKPASGPVFEALLNRVKALFHYGADELFKIHEAQSPVDLVVDIPHLYRRIHPHQPGIKWQFQDLPAVLADLPDDTPLALYGSGPAWLYAAVAQHIRPHAFYQFDARRGWVEPISLSVGSPTASPLAITVRETESFIYLHLDILPDYLEYTAEMTLPIPTVPKNKGIILSGKLTNWLFTGLTLFYANAPWVGVYYPHSNEAIVVVANNGMGMGQTVNLVGYEEIILVRR